MVTRINGFQYPYSSYQISISIIYICILLFFNFSILYNTIYINISYIILYINIILFICIIIVWIYIELIDPGKADPNITTKTSWFRSSLHMVKYMYRNCKYKIIFIINMFIIFTGIYTNMLYIYIIL